MKIKINSKYLIFPVNNFAASKTMCFYKDGKEVYKLNIRLDNLAPDYYAYIDLSRFYGSVLDISVSPDMEIKFTEADEINIEGLYNEVYRPQMGLFTLTGNTTCSISIILVKTTGVICIGDTREARI